MNGLEHKYTSLKTLLGDATSDWAKNKIFYDQYSKQEFANFILSQELPVIGIGTASPIIKTPGSSARDCNGSIKIEVRTNAGNDGTISTSQARQIALRVRKVLEPTRDASLNQWWQNCDLVKNYSLSFFKMQFNRFDVFIGDYVSMVYDVNFTFI